MQWPSLGAVNQQLWSVVQHGPPLGQIPVGGELLSGS